MPRGSSAGKSASRRAPLRNPPAAVARAPSPAPLKGSNRSVMGGLGATIAEGMAFGTGSAMAHRAVDAVLGPRVIQHETVASPAPAAAAAAIAAPAPSTTSFEGRNVCGDHSKALQDCLNNYGTDISKCQFYMDMLQECRRNSGSLSA